MSALTHVLWKKIIEEFALPKLYEAKGKLSKKARESQVEKLLKGVNIEEDPILESIDPEIHSKAIKELKLPINESQKSLKNGMTNSKPEDERIGHLQMLNKDLISKWSMDAYQLGQLMIKVNFSSEVCNKQYIQENLQSLIFDKHNISSIDEPTAEFNNLKILSLNRNTITTICNIPSNLQELYIYSNQINTIKNATGLNLKHLGVGYNFLNDQMTSRLCKIYSQLWSLDLSFNSITSLITIESSFPQLKGLRILNLIGNPVTFLPFYRIRAIEVMPNLTKFDLVDIPKSKKKQSKIGEKSSQKELEELMEKRKKTNELIDILNNVGILVEIGIADNIQGLEIKEEMISKIEKYEEIEAINKMSHFFVTYEILGKEYKTQPKIWKQDFLIESGEKGKCFFKYINREYFKPTNEFRDFLRNGFLFKLWESRPCVITNENDEKQFVIENEKIKFENILIGINLIDVQDWIDDTLSDVKELKGRFYFHEPAILSNTSYLKRNKNLLRVFSIKEKEFIDEKGKEKFSQLTLPPAEEKKVSKKEVSKAGKKAQKSQAKDVNTVEIPEITYEAKDCFLVLEKDPRKGVVRYLEEIQEEKSKKTNLNLKEETKQELLKEKKERAQKRILDYFDLVTPLLYSVTIRIKMNDIEEPKVEIPAVVEEKKVIGKVSKVSKGAKKIK